MISVEFRDPEAAADAIRRLKDLTGIDFDSHLLESVPSPDQALQQLEAWLRATSSPALQMQQMLDQPELGRLLMLVLGSSQALGDSLVQNPELSSIIFDSSELAVIPEPHALIHQGRSLVAASSSFSHSLDRLRFLRQRWMLPIVVNDLALRWSEPVVWRALSDLAEALITLALEVVWEEQKRSRSLDGECPLMLVGFGKLGGHELNYSSDIDLVYVYRDGGEEVRLSRVCEALTRAISDRMGRGQLYRVDLRLRPYGAAGPVAVSMKSAESYYDLYAEQWEIQALLRSRPITGPPELVTRWEQMRAGHCFKRSLSSTAIEESLAMRARTESDASSDDLKRGPGGIRDVEFLVQILQMVYGFERPALQVLPTLAAIEGLERDGILDHPVAHSLRAGYTFLRQLEHRLQFAGDQQTHHLPGDPHARLRLARMFGRSSWSELSTEIELHRRTIGSLYRSTLRPETEVHSHRTIVAEALGPFSHSGLQWFDVMPESRAFYESLVQNQDSLARVGKIVEFAPRLVPNFKSSVPLTEMLISGEIEEVFDGPNAIETLALDEPPRVLAQAYTNAWTRTCAQWVLSNSGDLGMDLAVLADALLRHCAKRLYAEFDVVALGSYALYDCSLDSDADLLFLVSAKDRHQDAETQAQFFLGLVGQLGRLGAPITIDLRLRPEGSKGLLVRTYEGFGQYELETMEMWERFALGQSRLLMGSEEAIHIVAKAAYAQPLTPERLLEQLAMKKRVETERVAPQHERRDLKLGFGSLSDIEWFVHLYEMRYPTATHAGVDRRMEERILALGRAGLINAIEVSQLQAARQHLKTLRLRLGLQGLQRDVLPENPDKLDRLARASGLRDGNSLLAVHERVIKTVRAIYEDGVERLRP